MSTILMVDDENPFLLSLKDGLSAHNEKLKILLANNGRDALDIISSHDIDLLVTDLKLPVMDGFQLLAQVSQSNPYMPVIVMTAFGTPDIEERLSHLNALHYLEKPLDFDELANTIDKALTTESNSYIRGITLATFLQLVHMEKKSCTLSILAGDRSGQLFIRNGELIDAICGELHGKDAALEIIAWDNAEIEMDASCRRDSQAIDSPLGFILMEAHRIKDENSMNGKQHAGNLSTAPPPRLKTSLLPDPPLVRYLKKAADVKEFAIFSEGNFIEYASSSPSPLAEMDPAYYLSASQPAGGFIESSNLRYLLFTTANKQQFMVFSWGTRRVFLDLRSSSRAGQLFSELKSVIDREPATHYRRGAHATTH